LIDNAVQHTPPGKAVRLEARRVEAAGRTWLECSVSDEGPGFRAEDLARVFEPFFTRRQGGTGLGLALVQRIAHEHQGEVHASNRPDGGARVLMRIPADET
jgi:signal transduction histidine kinase